MRILFFLNNVSKSRHFDGVIRLLAERGHTVVLAAERQRNRPLWLPKNLTVANRELVQRRASGRIEVTPCPVRRIDEWRSIAPAIRRARDYVRFLDPRYAGASKLERRSAEQTPAAWRRFLRERPWASRHWRLLSRVLAFVERAIPVETLFELFIRYEEPDVVVVTPLVDYGSYQTDYVKAAHRIGVPVVFAPFSWDNLTNRGLIRVPPDRTLVWNDIQQREAIELHDVDPETIVITGAPRFDEFFAMRPAATRQRFVRELGLDPAVPLILYICSSEFVAPHEVPFVRRWIESVRGSADPVLRSAAILVRPHPANARQWKDVDLSGYAGVALWSDKETMNSDQGLYDSLFHASVCVGLNTSAMIEAGIVEKPVLTLVSEEFAGGQEETLHFHYLRASNGGLLTEARTLEEHLTQLASAVQRGAASPQIRRFVKRFVRPRGIDTEVAPIMADEIERAAGLVKRARSAGPGRYAVQWALRAALAVRRIAVPR